MPVTVICPNLRCRSVLQVPEETRGKRVRCGRCGKNFRVPEKIGRGQASTPDKPEKAAKS